MSEGKPLYIGTVPSHCYRSRRERQSSREHQGDQRSHNLRIEVTDKSIIQANENYKITKNKYDNSLVTVTDLLDANVSMLQSRLSHELAKADALIAYNTLLQKAGILANAFNTKP